MENKVKVGKIVNTFGIKGELKVKAMTDFPDERFAPGAYVYLNYHGEDISFEIDSHRVHKGFDMISFVDMRDINMVEKYKGLMLYANKEDITLEDDEIWASDLIDCEVYDKGVGRLSSFWILPRSICFPSFHKSPTFLSSGPCSHIPPTSCFCCHISSTELPSCILSLKIKVFTEFVTILPLFHVLVFGHM